MSEHRVAVSTVIYRYIHKAGEAPCGQEEILVLRRSDNGKWNFPGGKVELGENLEQAAKREIREETGLNVRPTRIARVFSNGTDDGGTFTFVMFEVTILPGHHEVVLNVEHTESRWVTRSELNDEIVPEALPRLRVFAMGGHPSMGGIWHRDVTEYPWYQGEPKKIGKKVYVE